MNLLQVPGVLSSLLTSFLVVLAAFSQEVQSSGEPMGFVKDHQLEATSLVRSVWMNRLLKIVASKRIL